MSAVGRSLAEDIANDPEALAIIAAAVVAASKPTPGKLLRPAEVAEMFGVSERSVNRWAADGRLPAVKPGAGRGWRFDPAAIAEGPTGPNAPQNGSKSVARRRPHRSTGNAVADLIRGT